MIRLKDIDRELADFLLDNVINKKGRLTYKDVAEELTKRFNRKINPHFGLRNPLINVSTLCFELGLPLISATVIYANATSSQKIGEGFYPFACEFRPEYKSMNPDEAWKNELRLIRECPNWHRLREYLDGIPMEIILSRADALPTADASVSISPQADGDPPPEIVPVQPKATLTKTKQPVRPDIKRPSPQEVRHYLEKWNSLEGYREQEIALNKLFWEFCPNNTVFENILIKVAALNTFYSTNIFSVYNVARHILSLDIDERLKQGDTSLVSDIATGHGVKKIKSGKEIYFYSFATKYCSHHYPELFPIYDSFIAELLIYLRDADRFSDFTWEDLRNFTVFTETICKLREFYALESYSFKDMDKYLWQLGKESFPNKYKGKND